MFSEIKKEIFQFMKEERLKFDFTKHSRFSTDSLLQFPQDATWDGPFNVNLELRINICILHESNPI